jgi:CPA2 family monovalent cation:H+ antiporter-2
MAHLPDFITDLAVILITAGIVTIIFKWLKQPVVLGYIVAGFLASPFISWLPTVTDMVNVHTWAEIGVIFLLFALGLEFSFKKLMDVGGTASIATLINMGSMIIIGYIVGRLLGWSFMDSIFLGGMLSMSSTTIIIKAFNDMNLQKKKFAGIVFGMLIVEDLAAILMMVLLSTLAVSQKFQGAELFDELLKLLFFMLIWFVIGIFLIPTMLKKLKKYLNDETLLIVAVGLCLGMVLFASAVGFSAALGAFIMGSILAETIEVKRIEHLVEPLKNLFGAVFFVSVGMMIDPKIIVEYAGIIVLFTVVVLVGRVIFASLGVIASGQGLKVAIQSGFSLAQIGEFSFIIASLGMSLGVISNTLYPIIVAVSVITTFTTPYFIKMSPGVSDWLEKHIPQKWSKLITGYSASGYKTVNKQNDWNKLLKSILTFVAIYFTISVAIMLTFQKGITPFVLDKVPDIWGKILAAILTLACMAPFMRAIMMKKNRSTEFKNLWQDNNFNRGALISLIVLRVALCVVLVLLVLIPLFPQYTLLMVIIALAFITFTIFFQGFKKQSRKIEARFMENLHSKQKMDERNAAILPTVANDLILKDIHIEEFEVSPLSPSIGKTLKELNFRQKTGVNIITIIRGGKKINIPDGKEYLYPYDKIVISGSDEEIQNFSKYIEEHRQDNHSQTDDNGEYHHISLSQYEVEDESSIIGKTIIELAVREKTECMIIGIDRGDTSITNFTPNFKFEAGDVLWLAGEKDKLNSFEENIEMAASSI